MDPRRLTTQAVARTPAAGAPARHRGVSPAQALTLQRAVGNRATARVLARDAAAAGATHKAGSAGGIDTTEVEIRFHGKQGVVKFQALSFYWPLAVDQQWRYGVEITKYVDGKSPILWQWDARKDDRFSPGGPAEVTATLHWGGRKQVVKVEDAHITSHRLNPPQGPRGRPTETITLNAAQADGLPFRVPYERPRRNR